MSYSCTVNVGDIILSYTQGFYRVVEIERRFYTKDDEKFFDHLEKKHGKRPQIGDEYNPLIHSRRLLNSKFIKQGGSEVCDASFCMKVPRKELDKINALIESDPSIEENSIKKYKENINKLKEKTTTVIDLNDKEISEVIAKLEALLHGHTIDHILKSLFPQYYAGREVANGYVHAGKQASVPLNKHCWLRITYDELPGKITKCIKYEVKKIET